MANKPMPKIVGNEEDFREGFQSFIDLHGSTYKHVGAFCIKPPEKPEFNLELGRSQIHYPIRTWTQQCRKQLFADAYQIDAKSKRQDSMELCTWIEKEAKFQYFSKDMTISELNEILWQKLLPSKSFNPNYATGIEGSFLPSKFFPVIILHV